MGKHKKRRNKPWGKTPNIHFKLCLKLLFPSLDVWICTLNSELSLLNQPDKILPLEFVELDISTKNLINEAKKICVDFHAGRANKRSFAVSSDRFIPPHQYFAAKNYLESLKVK